MNYAAIQERIYYAYGKSANILGTPHDFYRPAGSVFMAQVGQDIITEAGVLVTTESGQQLTTEQSYAVAPYQSALAAFNAEDMNFVKPGKYGRAVWYGVFDGTNCKAGDYLVGAETHFIAAKQPLLPILTVKCNRVINVSRPQQPSGVGQAGYGGNTVAAETIMMQGWPASILQGTKGEKDEVSLPDDTRSPWWVVLLPWFPGATIEPSDIISDDLGRRYIVSSPELTDLGWRITATMAIT